MASTIAWKAEHLECKPSVDGLTNVVSVIHWRANAVDGDHYATSYGTVAVELNESSAFIEYEDLDEATVVGWAKNALGAEQVMSIETGLANQIATLKNPPVVAPPLPWAAA